MRSRLQAVVLPAEPSEFRDELRRIFTELDKTVPAETLVGECAPALDVFETDEALEVVVDLPDVDISAVRIVAKGPTLLIAGHKSPRRARPDSTFHLVERGYGRFVRAVRLTTACDSARARAILVEGELRVVLPKVAERRGRSIPIAVEAGPAGA
ncbi:MAG: Hsp20/alpha crystallin family protein [Vicinamibacterales bacterium]